MLKEIRRKLAAVIKDTEFEGKAYLAGGCVRDAWLGKETQDLDIVVELPEGGVRLAERLYMKNLTSKPIIYKQFGTAAIKFDEYKIELVMTRRESYRSRSRKPDVAFGSLREDVFRRDFTVNSLMMNISTGELLDIRGKGISDLKAGLIRTTSDPDVIFREDPLRLLRAVRFATELDFAMEKKTLAGIKKNAPELKNLSAERIASELLKIIISRNYLRGLRLLVSTGLKQYALPGLRLPSFLLSTQRQRGVTVGSTWVKPTLTSLSLRGRMVLLLWWSADKNRFLKMLKLPSSDRKGIANLDRLCRSVRRDVQHKLLSETWSFHREAWMIGVQINEFILVYPLTGALIGKGEKNWKQDLRICRKLKKAAEYMATFRFSLTGDDLMRTFCMSGSKEVGELLHTALRYWFHNPEAGTDVLLDYLKSEKGV